MIIIFHTIHAETEDGNLESVNLNTPIKQVKEDGDHRTVMVYYYLHGLGLIAKMIYSIYNCIPDLIIY